MKKPTIKQKKFVAEYVKTGNATKSALKAYDTTDLSTAAAIGSENIRKPAVQQAIEQALTFHEATPEFAVGRVKKIAEQDKELNTSLNASKTILELHGWRKESKPNLTLDVKQAFFQVARKENEQPKLDT